MTHQTQSNTETVDLWAFVEGAIGFTSDVAHGGTHLILTLDGKPVCAVVPMEDLAKLNHIVKGKEDTDEPAMP